MKTLVYRFSPPFLLPFYQRIEASPLGYRLTKGAFWSMFGQFASRGLNLLALVVTARILGKTDFGKLGMIQSTVGMFAGFATFGMGLTATKYVAELRKTDPLRAGKMIGLSSMTAWGTGGLMTLALVIFAPLLANRTMSAPDLANSLRLGAILLLFGAVNSAQNGALSGLESFKGIARVTITNAIICLPVSIFGAYYWDLNGAVAALVFGQAVLCFMTYREIQTQARLQGIRPTFSGALQEFHVLWHFSLPIMLGGLIQGPVGWLTNAMLVNQPGGYGELGQYNAALRIKGLPDSLVGPFLTPILPVLADKRAQGDWHSCKNIYAQTVLLISLLVGPFCILLMAAPFLAFLPFGREFAGGDQMVRWLMLHGILSAICGPIGYIFATGGQMWKALILNILQSSMQLLLAWSFVPSQHGAGLAIALAGAFAIQAIVAWCIALRDAPQILRSHTTSVTLLTTGLIACSAWLMGLVLPRYVAAAAGIILASVFVFLLARRQGGLKMFFKN